MISREEVGDGAAGEGALDRQLAVAAIDQDQQLHAPGTAVIEEGVERGADGAAGIEDVVHEDDVAAGDVAADGADGDGGTGACGGEVVAVEADVEDTGLNGHCFFNFFT